MNTWLITFGAFVCVLLGMSVGVIVTGKRIKGSCGGLATFKDSEGRPWCDVCADCPEKKADCELE